MNTPYSHFEYKKVIGLLKLLALDIENEHKLPFSDSLYSGCRLDVRTFEDEDYDYQQVLGLISEPSDFRNIEDFEMIRAHFFIGEKQMLKFVMGPETCLITDELSDWDFKPDEEATKICEEILPLELKENISWEIVLASFFTKVSTLYFNKELFKE